MDGPEFDGHLVNFDEAMQRQQIYKTVEGRAFLAAKEGDTHHGVAEIDGVVHIREEPHIAEDAETL